jgi:vacuolar protein sorting-associated protein 13A/C
MDLSKTVPRAFANSEEEVAEDEDLDARVSAAATPARSNSPKAIDFNQKAEEPSETVDLFPELAKVAVDEQGRKVRLYSKLEFAFSVGTVYLELFTKEAVSKQTLKTHSLARFSLNETDVKYKMVSNGSAEAEVLLRSFVSCLLARQSDSIHC